MCMSSSFLSLLSSGQPGGRNYISCTSAIPKTLPAIANENPNNIHIDNDTLDKDIWTKLFIDFG